MTNTTCGPLKLFSGVIPTDDEFGDFLFERPAGAFAITRPSFSDSLSGRLLGLSIVRAALTSRAS